MATTQKKEVLPGTEFEINEKIKLKLGTITPMAHADGWVMARYNSQAPYCERIAQFIDRVTRNL